MPPESCDSCRFFRAATPGTGECLKHSPVPQTHPAAGLPGRFGVWPLVMADRWCGDFQRRPAHPPEVKP